MIADDWGSMPTRERVEQYRGPIAAMRTDQVLFGDAEHPRDYVVHFGAVAVLAMDADDRVLVIQQYRHPVAAKLWEIPAGLLDKPGEDPLLAAKRELAEEAGFVANEWQLLVDYATTPGGSTELLRVYLARDLLMLPERPSTDEVEEQNMPLDFVPLDALCEAVLTSRVCNTSLVVGSLAAHTARADGWRALRPADTPWPLRTHLEANDRVFRR